MLLFNKRNKGYTLVEMLGTLAIISVLAVMVMPYGKLTVKRQHETELMRTLYKIRTAIDEFHQDWNDGHVSSVAGVASVHGYPINLDILVDGVPGKKLNSVPKKYLRRIPTDPFAKSSISTSDQWQLVGYLDKRNSSYWNGEDVYDVRSKALVNSISGSPYSEW